MPMELLVLLLLSAMTMLMTFPILYDTRPEKGDGMDFLCHGEEEGFLVIVPKTVRTGVRPLTTIVIPVFVTVPTGRPPVELTVVLAEVAGQVFSFPVNARLFPQDHSTSEILQYIKGDPLDIAAELRQGQYLLLEIDVSNLALDSQERFPLTITARATADLQEKEVAIFTTVVVQTLPRPLGWYAGDGHMHTRWSPDCLFITIDQRARAAVNRGLQWIVLTDHSDGIGDNWRAYVAECNRAQRERDFFVLPGFECTTRNKDGSSDFLGYACHEQARSIPKNKSLEGQELVDEIHRHRAPYSYAVLAHPLRYRGSNAPGVTGYRGLEVLNAQIVASDKVIDRWFYLLRAGLQETIRSGEFVVGVGNSDSHNFWGPGDLGLTWVHKASDDRQRNAIWKAIRAGRVSVSGVGDFGCFTVNGYPQGSVVVVRTGSKLEFRLVQQPVTGHCCSQIIVYRQDQTPLKVLTNPGHTEIIFTTTASLTNTFYLVRFEFKDSYKVVYDVWANPIFIAVS